MSDGAWNKDGWDTFRRWMNESLPFASDGDDFRWVTDYVDSVVKEALAAPAGKTAGKRPPDAGGKPLSYELFQTHRHVIVRFAVPERWKPRRLRVFAGWQRLRLEGLPNGAKQVVALPALVYSDSARALYKDGVLQVKLMKRRDNERFEEVYVRYE
ncbi:Hsp20/alpha crystallin family protein [Paenibacillus sp.]|uniref:Hsp20/alpha crystallin family protein n=1 Tax=Paenibacillus sp. TaxID=58172 RepID=UPI002D49C828|nr:Hsp20/alpha crystallin family protein [Paenibacillus sp.]HZG57113.1 Hsp20/alpha crystallin family protein [Paenibacillus sp.]